MSWMSIVSFLIPSLMPIQDASSNPSSNPGGGAADPSGVGSGSGNVAEQEELGAFWDRMADFGVTPEMGIDLARNLVLVLILAFLGWIVAGFVSRLVRSGLERTRFDATLTLFFSKMARWIILLLTVLAILGTFGVETTSLAAVIGATSLAIGLAFQGTLANFAAGLMLLIFRPFKVGDVVEVDGVRGTVREIELFSTCLDTPDNRRFILPNSSVFGNTIENVTFHYTRRCDVTVGVCYAADIDHTKVVLTEAIQGLEGVMTDPEPVIYLVELGASSVDWAVRVWCRTEDYWPLRERMIRSIKMSLDNAGISIPFPQLDVHLDQPLSS